MEGIHHLYQSVLHLENFRPTAPFKNPISKKPQYRISVAPIQMWRAAVCDMQKLSARDVIPLAFGLEHLNSDNGFSEEVVTAIPVDLNGVLGRLIPDLPDIRKKAITKHSQTIIDSLQEELRQLHLLGNNGQRIKGLLSYRTDIESIIRAAVVIYLILRMFALQMDRSFGILNRRKYANCAVMSLFAERQI